MSADLEQRRLGMLDAAELLRHARDLQIAREIVEDDALHRITCNVLTFAIEIIEDAVKQNEAMT